MDEVGTEILQAFERVYEIASPLFVLMLAIGIVPPLLRVVFKLILDGGVYLEREEKKKEIKDPKKFTIEYQNYSKSENVFYFYVTHLNKQNFLIALFTRFSKRTIKIGKGIYKKDAQMYKFSTNLENMTKIKNNIYEPVKNMKNYSILIQFHDDIHYALSHLSKFCEMQDAINLSDEIDKVSSLIVEIKKYADEIENAANAQVERLRKNSIDSILDKHHLIMEQLTLKAKIYNADPKKK